MGQTVELSSLDLRFEGYRWRDKAREARLLASIAERGIEQPLEGVDGPQGRLLLDGFKRWRCAHKLGVQCVPYVSLGTDEAQAIVKLLGPAPQQSLNLLEQAKFVVELLSVHQLSLAEVAQTLSRSKAWVGMRRDLLRDMSVELQTLLLRGAFPVYSYLYTLRPFMRLNAARAPEIEQFVKALADQRLSVREIELLAQGYFRGPASFRQAIDGGQWSWSLEQMQKVPQDPDGCQECERLLLGDIQNFNVWRHEPCSRKPICSPVNCCLSSNLFPKL
jgi:hypothetical protein